MAPNVRVLCAALNPRNTSVHGYGRRLRGKRCDSGRGLIWELFVRYPLMKPLPPLTNWRMATIHFYVKLSLRLINIYEYLKNLVAIGNTPMIYSVAQVVAG